MQATSCDPTAMPPMAPVPGPCIPFMYPDDGCWARAHEMCRLMQNQGLNPRKVWIQGHLHVNTTNHPLTVYPPPAPPPDPDCAVNWGWHVAPTLCVRVTWLWWLGVHREMVIDPSLFTTPVTQDDWQRKMDPTATASTLYLSDCSVFQNPVILGPNVSATDPNYDLTNSELNNFAWDLYNRSLPPPLGSGPPPYGNCPPAP